MPERKLWRELRDRSTAGFRFRRQHPLGPYIVDFICLERRLVIEVDGGQHGEDDRILRDQRRTEWLNREGYRVVRFWANDVMRDAGCVVEMILGELDTRSDTPT